MFLLEPL